MVSFALAHVTAAVLALAIGALIFASVKGTGQHRVLGGTYLLAMVVVNAAALTVFEDSADLAIFHYLAFASLATITAGYLSVRIAMRLQRPPVVHAYVMSWSYAGLAAAGVGQGAAALDLSVLTAVLTTLAVFGIAIHTRDMDIRRL